MSYKEVLERVLRRITPTEREKEEFTSFVQKTMEIAKEEAKKVGAEPILAGSVTRDTWLPSKKEFEIFLMFPENLSDRKLEEYGLKLGKRIVKRLRGKVELRYAQHPYVTGIVDKFSVDIVPCYKVKSPEKIKSAVDRTPFHVKYLEKKFSPKLSSEVRLLKQFLKANDIYGADAKTQGFSGYLCDLFILYYGSFLKTLKAVSKWTPGEVIDIESHWPKADYPKLRKKFRGEALIVIDPVDKNRNVASAVSSTNFYKFIMLAKEFLKRPSVTFFFRRKLKPLSKKSFLEIVKRRGTKPLAVVFKPPSVVPDILWPQLRKATRRLRDILEEYEFSVHRWDCWTDEKELAVILLEMEVWNLPNVDERIGPIIFDLKNSKNFIKKYSKVALRGPYIRDNRWIFEVKREWCNAREKLVDSLNESEKVLMAKGIPNFIARQIAKKFVVMEEKEIARIRNDEFFIFLRKFFKG